MSLLKALRRRWLLAASVGVLAAGTALAIMLMVMPTKFLAFGSVQVAANPEVLGQRQRWNNDFSTAVKTHAALFKRRDVILKGLGQEQVRDLRIVKRYPSTLGVIAWLEEDLKVDTQDGNEVISISLPGDEPEELCVLVNALMKSYLDIVNGRERGQRKERVKTMQGNADTLKEKLSEKIAARQGLLKGQGAPDSQAVMIKHQHAMSRLTDYQKQHGQLLFEMEKVRAKIALHKLAHKELTAEDIPDQALQSLLESDPTIKAKVTQIGALEKAITRMVLAGHPPHDPALMQARRKLAKMHQEVEEQRLALRTEVFERYQKKTEGDFETVQKALELELTPLEAHAKNMQDRVEQLARETEGLGRTTIQIELLNREIANLEKQHAEVDKQLKTFQVEEDAELRVTACQDAVWQVKDSRKRLIFLGLAPLAALGAVALGVAWWEFRARRIHSADEVAVGLGMRVLGAVPNSPKLEKRQIAPPEAAEAGDHHLIESIDALRTMLLRNASVEPTRLVMVTSAVAAEGKTTLAANLALSLARAGRRTLLVDCDLRRPALHQLFEQTLQPGFSEALLNEVELPDAVRPTTADENLWLLPAGQWDREVIQELAREHVQTLFRRLEQEFDFVIIDSHPVLPATDSLLIGQHVDAVLVSVMRGVSQAPRVYAAHQRLATLGIRVCGAVVNGMPSDTVEDGQHYQYTTAAAA
jgi:capsular exopolysaccharide synthesis family protein